MESATELLGLFESELNAGKITDGEVVMASKWSAPILIQLESLQIELETDGSEIALRRASAAVSRSLRIYASLFASKLGANLYDGRQLLAGKRPFDLGPAEICLRVGF